MVATLSSPKVTLNLPSICGKEAEINAIVNHNEPIFLKQSNLNLNNIKSGFACALHMHQPTIPAGQNGALICNLQHMFENQGQGDNHNATNHLDMESIESLNLALEHYEGTLIFVSHDREFVSSLATRVIEMTPDGINDFRGTYDEYLQSRGLEKPAPRRAQG